MKTAFIAGVLQLLGYSCEQHYYCQCKNWQHLSDKLSTVQDVQEYERGWLWAANHRFTQQQCNRLVEYGKETGLIQENGK